MQKSELKGSDPSMDDFDVDDDDDDDDGRTRNIRFVSAKKIPFLIGGRFAQIV